MAPTAPHAKVVTVPSTRRPKVSLPGAVSLTALAAASQLARYEAATRDGAPTFERLMALCDDLVAAGVGAKWTLVVWGASSPTRLEVEPPIGSLESHRDRTPSVVTVEGRAVVARHRGDAARALVGHATCGILLPLHKDYAGYRDAWRRCGTRAAFERDPMEVVRVRTIAHMPRAWVTEAWALPAVRDALTAAIVDEVARLGTITYTARWPEVLAAALDRAPRDALHDALAARLGADGPWCGRWRALVEPGAPG